MYFHKYFFMITVPVKYKSKVTCENKNDLQIVNTVKIINV